MALADVSRVIHVTPTGGSPQNGQSWTTAVDSLNSAILMLANQSGYTGGGLILIAPGMYLNEKATTGIYLREVKIQGAASGVTLKVDNGNDVIVLANNSIELADLTIWNARQATGTHGVRSLGSSVLENVRLTRCAIRGGTAAKLTKVKNIVIQDSMLEGEKTGLEFGDSQSSVPESYSCIASNSDFRAGSDSETSCRALRVDGGLFTSFNCNLTAVANRTLTTPNYEYRGGELANGGQVTMTSCTVVTDRIDHNSGPAGSKHVGFELSSDSRLKLTACTVAARDGAQNSVWQAAAGSLVQADASLLNPSP